jgi:hypothetical protein
MSFLSFWTELKDTHTVANAAARDTVKVNKCLLTRTVKTGRAMGWLTLSGDKQRNAATCTEALTHVTTGCWV